MIKALEGLPGWIWSVLVACWHWSPAVCIVVGILVLVGLYLGALELALAYQDAKDVRNRR
jgi:Ni,Fe-hydrogenase I cytochrome b subunit